MADIAKVKRNIQKMIDQGAPESDIDAYVASEGTTPEELQAKPQTDKVAPYGLNGLVTGQRGDASRWGMFPEAMDMVTMGGASKLNAAGGGLIDAQP